MQLGELFFDKSLKEYTSWRIGGLAKRYYRPVDADDLANFLKTLPDDEPVFWLGLGSNVLIRDGGFSGTVIHMHKVLDNISIIEDSAISKSMLIKVGAGTSCAKIAKFAVRNGLLGAEFFAGIPGTMGGALAMNAGAFGGQTWENIEAVETISKSGKCTKYHPNNYKIGYRSVKFSSSSDQQEAPVAFLAGYLRLPVGDPSDATKKVKHLLAIRNERQPIGSFNCGSVFKNPPELHAAQLIEASKLKNVRMGDAVVSSKHANFIVNVGAATAKDVEMLMAHIVTVVWQDHKVKLEPEVKIIGEP